MKTLYVGTYEDDGIYQISMNAELFSEPRLFCRLSGCKYLTASDNCLISIYRENEHEAGVAVIDNDGNVINKLAYEQVTSCFVTCRDNKIYTANFHEGTVNVISFINNELKLEKTVNIRKKAGCHQVLFHDDVILVTALFMDRIYIFNENMEQISEIVFPEGTGPRHGVFSDDHEYLYIVSELSNEVFVIRTADWKIINRIQLINDTNAKSAAIRLLNDNLYVSVRGADKIFVLKVNNESLTVTDIWNCHGIFPRDMLVDGDDIICANLSSDSLTVIRNGKLEHNIHIPKAVALCIK